MKVREAENRAEKEARQGVVSGEILPQPDPRGLQIANGTKDIVDSRGQGTWLLTAHVGQSLLITS